MVAGMYSSSAAGMFNAGLRKPLPSTMPVIPLFSLEKPTIYSFCFLT